MPMHGLRAGGLLLALVLAACGDGGSPSPSSSPLVVEPPLPSSTASAGVVPAAAQPYDGAAVLAAMRASTRPGGVPDEVETEAIAQAISELLWTWSGAPWETLSLGGACGPSECTVELAGSLAGAAGVDLYTFAVDPAAGTVTSESNDLHGYPAALDAVLDEMARDAAGEELGDLTLASARWLPPPDNGRYWLAYRTGGEEGSIGLDLLLDTASGEIVERREVLGQP
jgi:hypothetical protein